jgi:hypothetical protein
MVEEERETVRCRDAVDSNFVHKVRSEIFAHFHAVAVERHSSMQNRMFGLPGRILCEQPPWCQRKLWACSWLCFNRYRLLDFPSTVHALFPDRLPNHCQGLRRIFPRFAQHLCCCFVESIAKCYQAKCTAPNKRISISTELHEVLYTDFQYMLVLLSAVVSCYYNCYTNGRSLIYLHYSMRLHGAVLN